MKPLDNNRIIHLVLALVFIAGVALIFMVHNSFGGGDEFAHYQLARWGWEYPKLLFDHWGKPVFTILISPFAQFGIIGTRIYNLLMGFGAAVLIWKTAQTLKFGNSALSLLLVLFTPIYFILLFTTLTEVSFSFFLALAILLFFKQKYLLSAVAVSFLPLVRTEGIVLFPLFAVAYSLKKQWLALPLLTVGFWLISLLGYRFYDDFWWLITKIPYSGDAKDIYGSGSLFRFVNDTRGILGYPLGILSVVGLLASLVHWGKNDKYKFSGTFYFLLLVPGSYIVFLSAHSFVWWQGMGNSLGLIRVMGSVAPLAALTALPGLNLITDLLNKKNKVAAKIIVGGILFWVFMLGINTHRSNFKLSEQQQLIKQSVSFIKTNNFAKHKLYYFDPFAVFELGIDPFDKNKCSWGVPNKGNPSLGIPDSSIIIWDAHFGPNEGRVSLKDLQRQKSLKTITIINPEKPFTVFGHNYEVHVFMKDTRLNNERNQ